MIRDNLIESYEIFQAHKFGSKSAATQKKAKANAEKFKESLRILPGDLQQTMKTLWMCEYYIHQPDHKDRVKELRKKKKELIEYIEEQISSVVFP